MSMSINYMKEFVSHLSNPFFQVVKVEKYNERVPFTLNITDRKVTFFAIALFAGLVFSPLGALEAIIATVLTLYTTTGIAKYLDLTDSVKRYFQDNSEEGFDDSYRQQAARAPAFQGCSSASSCTPFRRLSYADYNERVIKALREDTTNICEPVDQFGNTLLHYAYAFNDQTNIVKLNALDSEVCKIKNMTGMLPEDLMPKS